MARAVPRLVLSEEAIRSKSGLGPHRNLAELRSLSIPGTYQEKITHLGHSLMSLTGLKSLDLSRNCLVSLEGIQYLTALQSLNLYYNCISSLAEVFRLHSLTELVDVDLRLNPVVKAESDYRLFVVHLLPRLRQLDDRPVRESERKASQLRFASEDSLDSKENIPAALKVGRPHHPRARCTEASAKQSLVMDADDEAVLNLIAECEWDLGRPPASMSSSQKEREAYSCGSQDSVDTEDSASSQKLDLSAEMAPSPLPAPGMYRKQRMPGGRFQAFSEQKCLGCLEGTHGSCEPEESLSRQNSSEGRSGRTLSQPEALETEEQRSGGVNDAGEVRGGLGKSESGILAGLAVDDPVVLSVIQTSLTQVLSCHPDLTQAGPTSLRQVLSVIQNSLTQVLSCPVIQTSLTQVLSVIQTSLTQDLSVIQTSLTQVPSVIQTSLTQVPSVIQTSLTQVLSCPVIQTSLTQVLSCPVIQTSLTQVLSVIQTSLTQVL
ncbi:centrosomal protein of 72 kDa, partial [Cebus imitator]|uniref:centrosomal protein of 72 kDa n=1 Tax=Cebus imitator TaxID=2715852 RepID=UPI00189AEF7B